MNFKRLKDFRLDGSADILYPEISGALPLIQPYDRLDPGVLTYQAFNPEQFIDWFEYHINRGYGSFHEKGFSSYGLPSSIHNSIRFRKSVRELLLNGGKIINEPDNKTTAYRIEIEDTPMFAEFGGENKYQGIQTIDWKLRY